MLPFLATLFALGTFWFWLLVFLDFVVVTALVENDEGVWATIVAIATLFGLNYLWKLPVLTTIKANPGHTALLVLAYFGIGVIWTFVKWYFFVHNQVVKYNSYKAEFLKSKNAETLTPELAAELADQIERGSYRSNIMSAPDPSEHKSSLIRWGTYWPFSMVGTALNDIVRKAWEYVYEMLQTTYQRMSKAIFRHAEADLQMAQEYKAKQAAAGAGGTNDSPSRRRGY
jgi:hypothetical protein